jgi:hypothetical protein
MGIRLQTTKVMDLFDTETRLKMWGKVNDALNEHVGKDRDVCNLDVNEDGFVKYKSVHVTAATASDHPYRKAVLYRLTDDVIYLTLAEDGKQLKL